MLAEEETARLEYIKQAAAQQVWCVAFEWLESSWDAGQLLPEGNYVYQGGAPRAGVSVARLSDEELDTIFTEAHVDYLSGSKTASQIAVELLEQVSFLLDELMAKHGTYTWSTWSQFFTQWRNRAGRFANLAAQQPVTERIVPLPTTALSAPTTGTIDMDKIFRNAHPMSLIPDRAYVDVARHLASIVSGAQAWLIDSTRISPKAAGPRTITIGASLAGGSELPTTMSTMHHTQGSLRLM